MTDSDTHNQREAALAVDRDVGVVAKGGAIQIVGQVAQRGLAFVFIAVAVRILGAAGYGLYRQVYQVLAIAGQLGLAGLNFAAVRFIARARARGEPEGVRGAVQVAIGGAVISSAIVAAALFLFAGTLAQQFAEDPRAAERMAFLLRLGAPFVPLFALTQVLRYCTQAYKTMLPSVVVGNIIQPVTRFIVGVVLLLAGFAVSGMVVTLWVAAGVAALSAYVAYRRILTPQELSAQPAAQPGPMVRFALLQAGASTLGVQSLGLGILILGVLGTDSAVGLFGIAIALQGPGGVFLSGITNIWAPVVTDIYERGDIDRLDSLYKTITRWIVTFSLPFYAALIVEPDYFVRLFAGDAGAGAAPVVLILALGNLFYVGTGPTGLVLSMTGRPGINFFNSAVAVVLYALIGFAVVPKHGVVGMAFVDAGVTAFVNSVRIVQAKALVGVQPFGRSMLKPIVATAAAAIVLFLWRVIAPGEWHAAGLLLAGLSYLFVLKRLGLDPEELYVWNRMKERARRLRASTRSK